MKLIMQGEKKKYSSRSKWCRKDDSRPCLFQSNWTENKFLEPKNTRHFSAWAPRIGQLSCSSQSPWCRRHQRWWRRTWDAIHAGQGHWPCHSCWNVPWQSCGDPVSVETQILVCSHFLRCCETAQLQQQCLNDALPGGSKTQPGYHRGYSWLSFSWLFTIVT